MREGEVMSVRDPHGYLCQFILERGFDSQEEDQPLLDAVSSFTRDQALLVFHVLDTRLQNSIPVTNDELAGLILGMGFEEDPEEIHPRVLH